MDSFSVNRSSFLGGSSGGSGGGFRSTSTRSPVLNFPPGRASALNLNPALGLQSASMFGRTAHGHGQGIPPYLATTPPNHFNFPLRSNIANGGVGLPYNGNGGGNGKGRGSGPGQGQQGQGQQFKGGTNRGQGSTNSGSEDLPMQQYRIFKRGDSIPGINSPLISSSGQGQGLEGSSSGSQGNEGILLDDQKRQGNKENSGRGSFSSCPPNKTPVSQVSDLARFHGLSVEYRLVGEKGPPHNPTFTVAALLGQNEKYLGTGSSIKRAQHAAAVEALEKTELTRPVARGKPNKHPLFASGKKPQWALMQLTALAEELKEPVSVVQQPMTIMDPFRRTDPPAVVSVHVGERVFTGEAGNFNAAKNMAIMMALKALVRARQEMELKRAAEGGGGSGVDGEGNKSPISVVHEMAMKRGLTVRFDVTKEEGPPHSKTFTVLCTLEGGKGEEEALSVTQEGKGVTKQAAKKAASELMIERMNEIPLQPLPLQLGSLKSLQRGLFRQKVPRKKSSAPVVKDLEKQTVSPISRLIQIAHIRKYKEPEFTVVASTGGGTSLAAEGEGGSGSGGPLSALKVMSEREKRNLRKKKPSFTMEVVVGPFACRGTGPNKKAAKKAAAEAALIELGFGPTEGFKGEEERENGAGANTSDRSGRGKSTKSMGGHNGNGNKEGFAPVSARQIVPGVLLLNQNQSQREGEGSPVKVAKEMQQKMNSVPSTSIRDGTEKLAYLAKLLGVTVSYSDFPKKNEYLSVVSLGTSPPQVAHGTGATLDEAQNMAALKMMEELSDVGLDNVVSGEKSGD